MSDLKTKMAGTPVFWARPNKTTFSKRREGERKPQLAHTSDYDSAAEYPGARSRYLDVIDQAGHVISYVLNSAAADLANDGSQRRERIAKLRHLGWIPVDACVIRLLKSGAIKPDAIVAKELIGEKVCPKDRVHCPHTAIEHKARAERNRLEMDENERTMAAAQAHHDRAVGEAAAKAIGAQLAPVLAELAKSKR